MDLLIGGTAFTPYYQDPDDLSEPRTTYYTNLDMTPEFAEYLIGLPVFIEHDESVVIGTVAHAYIDEFYQVKVILHITHPYARALLPKKLMRDPKTVNHYYYNALSLKNGTFSILDPNNIKCKPLAPVEISICKYGDRPFTPIDFFVQLPPGSNLQEAMQVYLPN